MLPFYAENVVELLHSYFIAKQEIYGYSSFVCVWYVINK